MKIKINDEDGTVMVAVLKLDGSPAIEGEDYALWSGEYRKNGKWSFTEGGVALREGIVVINVRSTHSAENNKKRALIVKDNVLAETIFIGRIKDLPMKPDLPYAKVGQKTKEGIIEACLAYGEAKRLGYRAETLARWAMMKKFD